MAETVTTTGRDRESARSRLIRLGFTDPDAAAETLAGELGELAGDLVFLEALGRSADPDLALRATARLLAAAPDADALAATLAASKPFRDRLLGVLGVSAALGDHLARHPGGWHALVEYEPDDLAAGPLFRSALLRSVGADDVSEPVATLAGNPARDALRVAYKDALLGIAARDVGADDATSSYDRTSADLSDLATATLEAALAVARAELPEGAAPARLAVLAMGKAGARELNYVSDVDVVFVSAAPETGPSGAPVDDTASLRTATLLAATMMRVCSDTTVEGAIWQVDANLRPEGKNGPLVRTLPSHIAYYQRWAKTWEFQALLKARPAAGDQELARQYVEALSPMVWAASRRDGFVADVQAMRRRVIEHIPVKEAERELKLGSGGLRDIEFAVQLLQLVHGPTDAALRHRGTLESLRALAAGGYVGRTDAISLAAAYRFLRTLEHRLQIHRLRRTHTLSEDKADLRRLGRSLGYRTDPVDQLGAEWKRHKREVRRLHEKLFYRPLLDAVARLTPSTAALGATYLTPEAAESRLEALGFADPAGALRHLTALTSGVSRRAAIQRTLLPVMLGWFADSPDPDGGLLAFRKTSEALGDTHWYLRLLRDEGAAAEHLAHILGSGRYAADLLLRAPEAVAMLGNPANMVPRARPVLEAEVLSAVGRAGTPEDAVTAARAVRRRELFRIAAADLLGLLSVDQVGEALSAVTAATLAGALQAATSAVQGKLGGGPLPTRLAIIAVGRFGGRELGYGSDADVLFVHEPIAEPVAEPSADPIAESGAEPIAEATSAPAAPADAPDAEPELETLHHPDGRPAGEIPVEEAAEDAPPAEQDLDAPARKAVSLIVEGELGEPYTDPALAVLDHYYVSEAELTRHAADALHDVAMTPAHPAAAALPLSVSPERERAATDAAHAIANEVRRLLQLPTADPPLLIDADLRPEGRQGPLVRTLASYAEYYRRWSVVWESQALLRAEPVAGDPDVGLRFLELADPLRWPEAGLDETSVREVRRIKARVEAERLPRGVDKQLHTKLGPGGLSDVEWTVQLIQLRHAYAVPGLRTTRTRQALQAAVEAGLLDPADAKILDEAWLEATRVRNGVTLVRGRAGDSIPTDTRERAGIAGYLGTGSGEFVEDYRRNARRARAVVERVFYG